MFYVNQPPYVRESENGSTFFARSSRRGRHGQWRGQNLVVVGALERWGMGRVSSSHGKGVWGEGGASSPENFLDFRCENDHFGTILNNILGS